MLQAECVNSLSLLELLVETLQKINRSGKSSGAPTPHLMLQDDSVLAEIRQAFHAYVVYLLSQRREHTESFVTDVLRVEALDLANLTGYP